MSIRESIAIWMSNHFDIPKYKVGEYVVHHYEGKRGFGVVRAVSKSGGYWAYWVWYAEPVTYKKWKRKYWWCPAQSLSSPYVLEYPTDMQLDVLMDHKG